MEIDRRRMHLIRYRDLPNHALADARPSDLHVISGTCEERVRKRNDHHLP